MKVEYEDSFVKIAGLLGGEEYVRVARALLNNENATDEEIASATGLKINAVRKALYDLFGKSLISGVRVRDMKMGWFVYRWKAQRDQVDGFIENQKRKALERLKNRLEYEQSHEFYHCGTPNCRKYIFEQAVEVFFKCQICGKPLNLIDNSQLVQAFKWKIEQIEKEDTKQQVDVGPELEEPPEEPKAKKETAKVKTETKKPAAKKKAARKVPAKKAKIKKAKPKKKPAKKKTQA
jgi:transcription initiation factor TFIIE subunit alpha